ncbi:MAG: phosphomethylpyrimidine synthase ThiC [bacterium]
MTLKEKAENKIIPPEIQKLSKIEKSPPEELRKKIAEGKIVIPHNQKRKTKICGIGEGLRTKVNANIGTSPLASNLKNEIKKLETAIQAGTDTIMDLSCGGNVNKIRKELISRCPIPFGTVPIYQAAYETIKTGVKITGIPTELFFEVIEKQAEDGVDFMTIHCGVTRNVLEKLAQKKRITGIVSRGGAIIASWMKQNKKENPFFENFGRLLKIAKKYDLTLSLGDGLRPGCLADATDPGQIEELKTLGKLCQKAWKEGVQIIIEGPGHIPIHQIKKNVELEKKYTKGAPFYCLGPLVTDVAPGYDHITSSIGAALAASYGVDFICYVTPAEHLKLPSVSDVHEGVIASRIAGHAADIAKGIPGALDWDKKMAIARKNLLWKNQIQLAIDPEKAKSFHELSHRNPPLSPFEKGGLKGDSCSMCGEFCAMKIFNFPPLKKGD